MEQMLVCRMLNVLFLSGSGLICEIHDFDNID